VTADARAAGLVRSTAGTRLDAATGRRAAFLAGSLAASCLRIALSRLERLTSLFARFYHTKAAGHMGSLAAGDRLARSCSPGIALLMCCHAPPERKSPRQRQQRRGLLAVGAVAGSRTAQRARWFVLGLAPQRRARACAGRGRRFLCLWPEARQPVGKPEQFLRISLVPHQARSLGVCGATAESVIACCRRWRTRSISSKEWAARRSRRAAIWRNSIRYSGNQRGDL